MITHRDERELLLRLLRVTGPLPYTLLKAWFKHFYSIDLTTRALREISEQSFVFFDTQNSYCYLYRGQKVNFDNEYCFYVMLKMLIGAEDTIVKARYPFDYLFARGEQEYLLINFEKNGEQKMRLFNNMDTTYTLDNGFIPVIIVLSDNKNFEKTDEFGNALYIPNCDYILAKLAYNPKCDIGNRYSVKFENCKGRRECQNQKD